MGVSASRHAPERSLRGRLVEEQRFDAPGLSEQLAAARANYAAAMRHFTAATEYHEQFTREAREFRELLPDDNQRAIIAQRAIDDCAYWDAETSAAEVRLTRIGRFALALRLNAQPDEIP